MLVGIISRPSSITCQIPKALLNCSPWIVQNCPKLGFSLSKSKSFHPVFIKVGEYVGGHYISTKFYNLPNPARNACIMALELSKNWISGICSPSRIFCSQKCCHFHWVYHQCDGRILCHFVFLKTTWMEYWYIFCLKAIPFHHTFISSKFTNVVRVYYLLSAFFCTS